MAVLVIIPSAVTLILLL